MKKQDYSVTITVNATAEEAFNCINNIAGWWTVVVEGSSERLNDVFTVRFGETFITIKITELVPYLKIGWQVIDCHKHWLKDTKEWLNTKMTWDIAEVNNEMHISFTHIGLVPGIECYNGCEKAWDSYIKESLYKLLMEGKGKPELR